MVYNRIRRNVMEMNKKERLVEASYRGIQAARRIYAACTPNFATAKYLGLVGSGPRNPNKLLTAAEDMVHRIHCEDVLFNLDLTHEDVISVMFVQEQLDQVFLRRHIVSEFCQAKDLHLVNGFSLMIDKELCA